MVIAAPSDQTPAASWDVLLEFIDDRAVIPIVGPELLRVQIDGKELPLQTHIAEKLAGKLGVAFDGSTAGDPLNNVVCTYLANRGRREDVYPHIKTILGESKFPTPEPLKWLAEIRHFNLFVSTTFDTLLEQAIDEVRFAGKATTQSIGYWPKRVDDLTPEMLHGQKPIVYHLLGLAASAPKYVINEEDMLEFLYAMQTERGKPEALFEELANKNLLLIGNSLPDWLARFFIRITKGKRLSDHRDSQEIIADQVARNDRSLVLFLQNFSYHTQVFAEGNAYEFVQQLAERYRARHPVELKIETPITINTIDAKSQSASPPPAIQRSSIFISYARDDQAAAERIAAALGEAHLDVWLDKRQLEAADIWENEIRKNIKTCLLFLAIISKTTQDPGREGFFRREWKWAADRRMDMASSVPFIVPVAIDGVHDRDAEVPDEFHSAQWLNLPDGKPTPDFVKRVQEVYRKRQVMEARKP